MKHMEELKQRLRVVNMNQKGTISSNISKIILLTMLVIVVGIMILIIGAVFYLLWNPLGGTGLSIRGTIFNFFNDTNFLATFPGLDQALILALDITPMVIGFTLLIGWLGLVAFVGVVIAKMAQTAAK